MSDKSTEILGHQLHCGNAFQVLENEYSENHFHAVVTDPPYAVIEFETANVEKMRNEEGGVWRQPPELDGSKRKPIPRFTVLSESDKESLRQFFSEFGTVINRVLRPGGYVFIATTQLLMHEVSKQLDDAGLERRDVLMREVKTLRGGDRPKGARDEFDMVCSMPRVWWEPWLVYRKPFDSTLKDNLQEWGTGGLRRESNSRPFVDLLTDGKTPADETEIVAQAHPEDDGVAHPNLKPQQLMRELCHTALPLQEGTILDPFMGAGSTIAAAEALEYDAVGIEIDKTFYNTAQSAIPELAEKTTDIEDRDDIS